MLEDCPQNNVIHHFLHNVWPPRPSCEKNQIMRSLTRGPADWYRIQMVVPEVRDTIVDEFGDDLVCKHETREAGTSSVN